METNHLIQANAIFIVGGGPSVRHYNLSPLVRMGYVLGVNDAFLHTPCHGVASMDGRWMSQRTRQLQESGLPFFASKRHFGKWVKEPWEQCRLFDVEINHYHLSNDPSVLYAKHSGAIALNVAYLSRPKQIYLFGFDHRQDDSQGEYSEHWYGQYEWRAKKLAYGHMNDWVADHSQAAKQFKAAGIEVFNVSPISKIQSYERIRYEAIGDYLARIHPTQ